MNGPSRTVELRSQHLDRNPTVELNPCPEILSWREIAALAFDALGKPAKISAIPTWVAKGAVGAAKIFNRHQGELLAFFTEMATSDVVAPAVGSRPARESRSESETSKPFSSADLAISRAMSSVVSKEPVSIVQD